MSPSARKRLVVTADDFGLAPEINEAVERAHRDGILTAASLMVGAPAAADAVQRARRLPRLRVGLHVALVDAVPVLPPHALPALVGRDGRFRRGLVGHGTRIFSTPDGRRQARAEIAAQFAAFRATGLVLDHVDAHRHFHLHPTIGAELIRQAVRHGARVVRVPREPAALLAAVEAGRARLAVPIAQPFVHLLARRVRHAGLLAPDRVLGIAWSGAMHRERLLGLLHRLPDGLTEIYLHPAIMDAFAGATPGYGYAAELAALLSPEVATAVRRSGASLGGFTDVLADPTSIRDPAVGCAADPSGSAGR